MALAIFDRGKRLPGLVRRDVADESQGLFTFLVGVAAVFLMPAGPCQTANWARGKKGWFSAREEEILVNRVLRDDPSKGSMHNRQPVTPGLLWKSLKDFDLWYVPCNRLRLVRPLAYHYTGRYTSSGSPFRSP